jgi:toxin ParE1/3/4
MPRILRTRSCDADLFDIAVRIAEHNPPAADALIDVFHRKFGLLAEFPSMGRQRPELGEGIRSLPIGNYMVFYRPVDDGIELIRVLHGSRNARRQLRHEQ